MIANEVQYHATKAHLDRFDEAAANQTARLAQDPCSRLTQFELDAARAQADDLRGEIVEYEHLCSDAVSAFEAATLEDLPTVVIKARIARGWSQCRLGEALGTERQVQRYEFTGYQAASLARICDVAAALGVAMIQR